MAGSYPQSTDITLITCDEVARFEKIGDIPGVARDEASLVLVRDRFVVGFGGTASSRQNDLWIFDLKTRRASQVGQRGDWHPRGCLVPLVFQGDTIYLISGWGSSSVHCISLTSLADLIRNTSVRIAFCAWLGLPLRVQGAFMACVISYYAPECL